MKNIKNLLSLSLLLGLFLTAANIQAQSDAKAAEVLKKVESAYANFKQIQGDFTMSIDNADLGISETKKGQVAMKGAKYRLVTDEYEIVCNGTTVWTFFKEDDELTIDNYDPDESEMSPVRLLSIYKEDYSAKYDSESTYNGVPVDVLNLFPNDVDNQYSKVEIKVNQVTGLIVSAEVYSRNGTSYTISIDQQGSDTVLSNSDFELNTEGLGDIDIIDFR